MPSPTVRVGISAFEPSDHLKDSATPTSRPAVRLAEMKDVPAIVDIHLLSFPGFFLSSMGPTFLRHLYQGIIRDVTGFVLVVAPGDRIRGFVAGTTSPAGFYGRLLRRAWPQFFMASIPPLLRKPGIIPKLLRSLRKPGEEDRAEAGALLMSLAVDPKFQRNGDGRLLLAHFCERCRAAGVNRVRLTTDGAHNDGVNTFYTRQGFQLSKTFETPEGRIMNEYTRELTAISELSGSPSTL